MDRLLILKTSQKIRCCNQWRYINKYKFKRNVELPQKNKSHATMAVKVMVNSNPYGVVKSKGLLIDNFQEKPVDKIYINAGIYIISNSVISLMKKNTKIDAPKFLMILKKKKKSNYISCT